MKITKKTGTLTILFLAQIVLLLSIFFSQTDFHTPDSFRYLQLAESLETGQFGLNTVRGYEVESLRLPGYPFFILVCHSLFGNSPYSIIFAQMLLHLFAVWLIYLALSENFGTDSGVIFLLLSLFFPVAAFSSVYILPETTSLFLISAGVFLISKESYRNNFWSFCLAGICFGLAAYMRTNLIFAGFVVAFTVFVFFPKFRRAALLMSAVIILVIAPWLARNYLLFGSLSGANVGLETIIYQSSISSKVAARNKNLFRRNDLPERYEDYENEEIRSQLVFLKNELGMRQEDDYHKIVFDLPPEKTALAKRLLRQKAFENISDAPLYFLTQSLANAPRMWIAAADSTPGRFPKLPNIISLFFGGLTLICAIGGGVSAIKSKNENIRFLGLLFVSLVIFLTISLCFLHLEIRYATPAKLLFIALASNFIGSFMSFSKIFDRK